MIDQSYVPARLAIEAMRDNGYKNTAYAVAELIDNAIQAEATFVQFICAEKDEVLTSRITKRIQQIAILDNGKGMDTETLKISLQFGNGTRLGRSDRSGIGRFGMGLPASSISQCQRVDVWTWQNGVENAYHTYLDVNEIKSGSISEVPTPTQLNIPIEWRQKTIQFEHTGTLVVWSQLDRLFWSKAKTLIDNSEFLIGRMYRRFLNSGSTRIRMMSFNVAAPNVFEIDKEALPNDPCYLMGKTSCPEPYGDTPLFELFGEEKKFSVPFHGANHDVIIRYSYAKQEARDKERGNAAGSTPYGKHAAKNVGVSIVRAGRELEINQSMVKKYDSTERWWGVEIDFPPALDEIMGVTNNKQFARTLAEVFELTERDSDNLLEKEGEGKSFNLIKMELKEEGDPRGELIDIAVHIHNQLSIIRRLIKDQTKGRNKDVRYDEDILKAATEMTEKRKEKGFVGSSDKDEDKTPEIKQEEIKNDLIDSGVDEDIAEQLAEITVVHKYKYLIVPTPLPESDAFFVLSPRGGSTSIMLNTRHPAYEHLVEILDEEIEGCDAKELGERLKKAAEGLKLLLIAWARYEDELPDGQMKEQAQETRRDWGRIAKEFLRGY